MTPTAAPRAAHCRGSTADCTVVTTTWSGTRALTVKFGAVHMKSFRAKLTTKAKRKKGITISVDVTATDTGGIATSAAQKVLIKG
jgi:hypothetical protein